MDNIIDQNILERLDRLIQNEKWEESNFKKLASKFRYTWCRQSKTLQSENNHSLIKKENPKGVNNDDLLRIYAGYWIIRSLYGIGNPPIDEEEGDSSSGIIENSKMIRHSSLNALYYLKRLFKKNPALQENMENILNDLRDAERTGEPPLIPEYNRRKAEGRKILNSFRLTRFRQVLHQLDKARSGFA